MQVKIIPITKVKTHIAIWLLFIAYEICAGFFISKFVLANIWDDLASYALNAALFYFNAHVALPNTINETRKNFLGYFVIFIAQMAVFLCLKYAILYVFQFLSVPFYPPFTTNRDFILNAISRGVYFLGFSAAYWFALTTIRNQKQVSELEALSLKDDIERRKLERVILATENAYLKSQINPHFLFNTLSFLYNSVSKFSSDIAENFMTLADFMRYALADTGKDGNVPLELELDHIHNFVNLNQSRFSQRLRLNFEVVGDPSGYRIPPLILMTLVENVFKYGDLFNDSDPAMISVNIDPLKLKFTTKNAIKKQNKVVSSGIGLENLKKRLKNSHQYKLNINDTGKLYEVELTVWR